MKRLLPLLALLLVFFSCLKKEVPRETVLDNISHVEDSITYHIDSLPRLCDELGINKQLVDIGNCQLYCEVEGKGIPLVLINGGPGGTHHYFHPWFSRMKDLCRVIYYDQRGCGLSGYVKGDGYTFKQAMEDLDKLRQQLGIDRWIILGFSYGGALAQYYTASYPEHVSGLVLVGAAPVGHDPRIRGSRQQQYISDEEKQKIDRLYGLHREGKLNLTQLMYNKSLNGDWKRQNFIKPTREEMIRAALYEWVHDNNFNRSVGNTVSCFDFRGIFNGCPIPTLLCEGKWDLTWSEQKAQVMKENHPHARFVHFEHAGHRIFNEQPELFFSTLREFTGSLSPVSEDGLLAWKTHASNILSPQETLFKREIDFLKLVKQEGITKAAAFYKNFINEHQEEHLFSERGMNRLGYVYMGKKDYQAAITLFKMNTDAYPNSFNAWDSLGEACLAAGDRGKAVEYYRKSVQLNPHNENGKKVLEKLGF